MPTFVHRLPVKGHMTITYAWNDPCPRCGRATPVMECGGAAICSCYECDDGTGLGDAGTPMYWQPDMPDEFYDGSGIHVRQ